MDRNDSNPKCVICGADAVDNPYHFNQVCAAHHEYGTYYQLWIALKELGLPYEMPEMKCVFCGDKLSAEQIARVSGSWVNIVCETHKEFYHVFQIQLIKDILKKYPGTTTLEQVDKIRLRQFNR